MPRGGVIPRARSCLSSGLTTPIMGGGVIPLSCLGSALGCTRLAGAGAGAGVVALD